MDSSAQPERSGFSVGPVFAAALLCIGLQAMVRSLRLPLSALVVFLIQRSYPETLIGDVNFAWVVQVASAILGAILIGAGLGLGGWLRSDH